jgi:hypothetical protein
MRTLAKAWLKGVAQAAEPADSSCTGPGERNLPEGQRSPGPTESVAGCQPLVTLFMHATTSTPSAARVLLMAPESAITPRPNHPLPRQDSPLQAGPRPKAAHKNLLFDAARFNRNSTIAGTDPCFQNYGDFVRAEIGGRRSNINLGTIRQETGVSGMSRQRLPVENSKSQENT